MQSTTCQQQTGIAAVCRNQRRRYIVNARFQWRFVLSIAAIVFLTSSIISSLLYGALHAQARARFMEPTTYIAEVPLVVIGFSLLFSSLAAVAVGFWCVFATHRMCGPLHLMTCHFKELAAGRLPKPRSLRARDEFKEFYEVFSQAVEAVRNRQQQGLRIVSQVTRMAEGALDAGDEARKTALLDVIGKLRSLEESIVQTGCME